VNSVGLDLVLVRRQTNMSRNGRVSDDDDFVQPKKRGKRNAKKSEPLTADQLRAKHKEKTDEITDILKHINAVNFFTPYGCLVKMFELCSSSTDRFHEQRMTKFLIETFSVSMLFNNINNNLNINITCDKKLIIFYILKNLGSIEKTILWKMSQASMIDAFLWKRKFYAILKEKIKEANRICGKF
jgi:hypothetical protein